MAETPPKTADAPEKLSWKLFILVVAGALGFIGAAIILAP
jgi:hypothetical protein